MKRESSFIPNSFQTPNAYVDSYLHLLTGEEWKALTYATRRILGFQKRRDRISVSQFAHGIIDSDGNRLDYGCGLRAATVVKVVESLVKFGFLTKTAGNDPKTSEGTEYELQLDDAKINLSALIARGEEWKKINQRRTRKATLVLSQQRVPSDGTAPPLVGRNDPPLVGRNDPPLVGRKHNNQRNTGKTSIPPAATPEEIEEMGIPELLQVPEIKLYRSITKHIPGNGQIGLIVEFMRKHQPTQENLSAAWKAWRKQDYRVGGLGWLDWVVEGIPDFSKKNGKKTKHAPAQKSRFTEEEIQESIADAAKQFGLTGG